MRVAAYTLGCKVNQYDTNAMMELLVDAGFERVGFHEEADIYLINTCTVTNTADKKSRNMIRRIHRLYPNARICVCGCLPQRESESIRKMGGVSAVVGTKERGRIVETVRGCLQGKDADEIDFSYTGSEAFEELRVRSGGELTRGYIKVQEGCNNFCSYCIIPYVRGRVRSRDIASIRQEALALAQSGVQEIVLTGIHISSYGQDSGEKLLSMLGMLNGIQGIRRIRLGSLEPHILQKDFVQEVFGLRKICPHFHVSLQSGSDRVLAHMNRRYTTGQYREYIRNVRDVYARPAITTDIITGFPGESEADFLETCAFAQEMAFSRIHVFPYSQREGTPAAAMEGQVPIHERRERANRLIALGKRMEWEYMDSFLQTEQEVIFEQQTKGGLAEGYTDRYVRVHAQGTPGECRMVLLKERKDDILYGKTKEEENG